MPKRMTLEIAGFIRHEAISANAARQIDDEVGMQAVTCLLDLAKVFQSIKDGFNQRSSLEERVLKWRVLDLHHVLAHLGDEIHLKRKHQVDQLLGGVPLVRIHPAK